MRARLTSISRRLSEISEIDLEQIPQDRVGFGSKVEVLDLDDDVTETYTVAFGDVINLENSEISMASPIGKALLGKAKGEEAEVTLPGGQVRYRIIRLATLHELAAERSRP